MTKNSKRSADIKTDRNQSELPILDRLLPLDSLPEQPDSTKAEISTSTEVSIFAETGSEILVDSPSSEEGTGPVSVSMNSQHLEYDQPSIGLSWGRRVLGALLPATAAAVAVGSMLVPVAAGAQVTPDTDLDVKSVRFDLASPDNPGPTSYRSLVVTEAGVEHSLEPMTGAVRVTMTEPSAASMTAVSNGAAVTYGDPAYSDSLAAALSSPTVTDFARLSAVDADGDVSVDIYYDRPLGPGDHLLIQEGNGDGGVNVTPLDANGQAIGSTVRVGSPYQVNTGHDQEPAGGMPAWASIVDIGRFGTGSAAVAGVRVSGQNVEVKAMALVATEPSGLTTVAAATDGEAPVYASVGLEAKVQPALAVDGAGCLASPASSVAVGQAATFCFLVTNLGTTSLTELRVTDPQLGLVNADLPMASGQPTLQPGDQAVLYHHAVAGERSDQVNSIISARPVDGDGNSVANLIAPTGIASPGAVGVPASAAAPAAVEQASAGALSAADSGSTDMAEVPAARANGTEAAAQTAPAASVAEASEPAPTQLAMTGVRTEPWILVVLAMGLIFIGYTAYAAFVGATRNEEFGGHDQLDFLGFD